MDVVYVRCGSCGREYDYDTIEDYEWLLKSVKSAIQQTKDWPQYDYHFSCRDCWPKCAA